MISPSPRFTASVSFVVFDMLILSDPHCAAQFVELVDPPMIRLPLTRSMSKTVRAIQLQFVGPHIHDHLQLGYCAGFQILRARSR